MNYVDHLQLVRLKIERTFSVDIPFYTRTCFLCIDPMSIIVNAEKVIFVSVLISVVPSKL